MYCCGQDDYSRRHTSHSQYKLGTIPITVHPVCSFVLKVMCVFVGLAVKHGLLHNVIMVARNLHFEHTKRLLTATFTYDIKDNSY